MGQGSSAPPGKCIVDLKCLRLGFELECDPECFLSRAAHFLDACLDSRPSRVELLPEYCLKSIFGAKNMLVALQFLFDERSSGIEASDLNLHACLYLIFLEAPLEGLEHLTIQRLDEEEIELWKLPYIAFFGHSRFGNHSEKRKLDGFSYLKYCILVKHIHGQWLEFLRDDKGIKRLGVEVFTFVAHSRQNRDMIDFCSDQEWVAFCSQGRKKQKWSKSNHRRFPLRFREIVFILLLLGSRYNIPKDVLGLIIQRIAPEDDLFLYFRETMT
jgi:hypothetical protein